MKPITVNASEDLYREFKVYARQQDRKTAELVREAMELYRETKIRDSGARSLRADLSKRLILLNSSRKCASLFITTASLESPAGEVGE